MLLWFGVGLKGENEERLGGRVSLLVPSDCNGDMKP